MVHGTQPFLLTITQPLTPPPPITQRPPLPVAPLTLLSLPLMAPLTLPSLPLMAPLTLPPLLPASLLAQSVEGTQLPVSLQLAMAASTTTTHVSGMLRWMLDVETTVPTQAGVILHGIKAGVTNTAVSASKRTGNQSAMVHGTQPSLLTIPLRPMLPHPQT